jgi:predicted glycosyltransferase
MEQYIRAARAQELGLVSMLTDDDQHDPHVMATALRQLPQQKLPSQVIVPGLLDGQRNVFRLVDRLLAQDRRARVSLAPRQSR